VRYHPVSIVWRCEFDVSAYVALGRQVEVGEHACPDCGLWLGRWGGYWRWIRGPGTERLWIRRCRCSKCRRSHALLPDFLLERRLDEVGVIGHALALSIGSGLGMRPLAERLGVPMTTVRDWRRRFQVNALMMVAALVAVAVHLDPAPVLLSAAGHETVALEALGATWDRARRRFAEPTPELWRFWSVISGGQALGTNRSPPYPRRSGADWMTLIP
jgi:transposase-like protein